MDVLGPLLAAGYLGFLLGLVVPWWRTRRANARQIAIARQVFRAPRDGDAPRRPVRYPPLPTLTPAEIAAYLQRVGSLECVCGHRLIYLMADPPDHYDCPCGRPDRLQIRRIDGKKV
jgi:hypothetical protein